MRSDNFFQQIKKLLQSQKNVLMHNNTLNDIDADGDETDEIQASMIIGVQNELNSRNNFKLQQINNALKKITNKTYGLCEDCNEEIPEKRLLSNPHFIICVGCAEDREREEKNRRR